jgi:hypothetical protein
MDDMLNGGLTITEVSVHNEPAFEMVNQQVLPAVNTLISANLKQAASCNASLYQSPLLQRASGLQLYHCAWP